MESTTRSIKTTYYHGKKLVRVNRAKFANNAVPLCVHHMQVNEYDATTAEVYDDSDGTLHAVIKRSIKGDIHIVFKREVKEWM